MNKETKAVARRLFQEIDEHLEDALENGDLPKGSKGRQEVLFAQEKLYSLDTIIEPFIEEQSDGRKPRASA